MNVPELALHHQRLDQRAAHLRSQIDRLREQLASDPVAEALEHALAAAQADRRDVDLRLLEREREVEAQRSRLRGRERELMSGRIRNPTELMQMSDEVAHMRARFAEEEEAELRIMEDAEAADEAVRSATRELEEATRSSAEEEPGLRAQLGEWNAELTDVVGEKEAVWAEVPPRDQAVFNRIRVRPPIARVSGTQCTACHVTVTSSGMQILRKGDALVQCENCGRILVQS